MDAPADPLVAWLVVRYELKKKEVMQGRGKSAPPFKKPPNLWGSYLQDGNCDLFRLLIVLCHALFRLVSEDDQSDGNFPTVKVGYSQYADLIHVRVIPNQDLQLVSGDLEATDFED